jgi:hypothetical protein
MKMVAHGRDARGCWSCRCLSDIVEAKVSKRY